MSYHGYYADGRPKWDDQFRETEWERNQRMKEARQRRTAEGKCWQCAKVIAECKCPNVKQALPTPSEKDKDDGR